MDAPSETEIKFLASPAMLDALRQHPRLTGPDDTVLFRTTYFDTPSRSLQRGGASLRLRTGPAGAEQTLKLAHAGGPIIRRTEWTVAAPADRPVPALFPDAARAELDRLVTDGAVAPVAEAMITRTTRRVHAGASVIELAFDTGTIRAGARLLPVCELELELIEGRASDLFALALDLPAGPDLQWSIASKTSRALALAFDLPAAPIRPRPVTLPDRPTVAAGFRLIGWNGLEQLLGNYPLVIAGPDPEAVHQTRVAIRRLRAAIALFRAAAAGPPGSVFQAELKAVAAGLAPARDLHLLLARAVAASGAVRYDYGGLQAELASRRDAALASARRLLAGAPFQRLLLAFALWLEETGGSAAPALRDPARALERFAPHALSRLLAKVRKLSGPLATLPDRDRHKLRIAIKTLRYATEFLAPLHDRAGGAGPDRRFGRALTRLQDSLGALNDLTVARTAPPALLAGRDPIAAARLGAEFEALLGRPRRKRRRRLLRTAQDSLDALQQAPSWWTKAKARP